MMRIATTGAPSAVPEPIVRKLKQLIHRVRAVISLRGVCAIAVVLFTSLLVVMGIDVAASYFRWSTLVFSTWPRWVMTSLVWAGTLFSAFWFLVRPLARTFTLTGIARALEQHHPELHERLSSAVELLTSKDAPALRGSDVLIAALAQEAALDAGKVQPKREISPAPARPFLIAATAVFAVLGSLFAIWPEKTARLLARAVAPHLNLGTDFRLVVTTYVGDVKGLPDRVVAEGDSLRIKVEARNSSVDRAELRHANGDGGEAVLEMMNVSGRDDRWPQFAITFPTVTESFKYRVYAGRETTRYYSITVVPRPAIKRLDIRYDYPPYTGRAADTRRGAEGDIRAVAGTDVTVTAVANTRVTSAELIVCGEARQLDPGALALQQDGATACTFRIRLEPKMKGQWQLNLVSKIGEQTFTGSPDQPAHAVEALADAEPTARIFSPESTKLKLKPTDVLPILYAVGDDYGVGKAELLVKVGDQPVTPIALTVPAESAKTGRIVPAKTSLDLSALKLDKAGQVTFQLRALDKLPANFLPGVSGPQQGLSDVYTITLDVKAASYQEQMMLAEELLIRQALLSVLKDLKDARAESDPLRKTLERIAEAEAKLAKEKEKEKLLKEKAEALGEAQVQRVDQILRKLSSSDATVQELIPQIAGGSYASLAEKLGALSGDHIVVAQKYATEVKVVDELAERAGLAKKTDFHIWRAIEIVEELLKQFDAMTALMHRAEELEALAAKESELAAEKAAMEQSAAKDASAEKEWQKSQEELARQVGEMVKKTPGALAEALKSDKKEAQNLAEKARELAKEQKETAEQTRQAAELDKTDSELKKLAAEQAELARQTESKDMPQPAKPMAAAAEDIKTGELNEAIKKQQQAETGLKDAGQKAQESAKNARTLAELARRAEEVAREQKALAEKAKSAVEDAGKAAGQEAAQKQLAQKEAQIVKQAENAGQAAKEAAAQHNPTGKMEEAAKAMDSAESAAQSAQKAAAAESAQKAAAESAQKAADQAARKAESEAGAKPAAEAAKKSAAQAAQKANEASAQKAAAQASQKAAGESAQKAASEAAKEAGELAKALQKAAAEPSPQAAQAKGQQAAELGGKQAEIRRKTEELAKKREALAQAQKSSELARLAAEQADVAKKAAEMVDKVKATAPQPDNVETDAAAAAQKAAEEIKKPDVPEAAKDAGQAAEKLGELAKRLGSEARQSSGEKSSGEKSSGEKSSGEKSSGEKASGEKSSGEKSSGEKSSGEKSSGEKSSGEKSSGEKSSGEQSSGQPSASSAKKAQLAGEAGELAERQAQLAKEMAALAGNRMTEAAAAHQQEVTQQTEELKKDVAKIQEHAEELIPDSSARREAQTAGNELAEAQKAQGKAQQAMSNKQPAEAVGSQQAAASELASAAAALDRLGKALAEAAGKASPAEPEQAESAGQLADAYDAAAEAAASAQASAAQQAASMLAALAQAAAAQAQAAGAEPGNEPGQKGMMPGQPAQTLTSKMGVGMVQADLSPAKLKELGITLQDWARLPGKLRDQVLQAAADDSPGEYRDLIKRYFQEIIKRGGVKNAGKSSATENRK
jgi:hypothetical protein